VADHIVEIVTQSDWAYVLIFACALLDAVVPIVPSEAIVITAAALATSGRLTLGPVYLAAVLGAAAGDNAAYAIGRLSSGALDRVARRPRAAGAMVWAATALRTRGPTIVIASRFVPGGRTATMLTAGATKLRWRRFAALDAVAVIVWAAYGVAIGSLGGVAFADRPFVAVTVALVLAALLALVLEGVRRLLQARRARRAGTDAAPGL
jgi:membrane protein DedA with SNARE-associated domain